MKIRKWPLKIFLCTCVLWLTGCTSMIRNDTPEQIPQNGSEIYTIAMAVTPNGKELIAENCSARIVINGEVHGMNKGGPLEYTYNYKREPGKHKASYYYELDYAEKVHGRIRSKFERTKLYDLVIANRYAIGFESNRGIPGSQCTLIGRGFEKGDYVEIGGVSCNTTFNSQNSLAFVVPMLPNSGHNFGFFHAKWGHGG